MRALLSAQRHADSKNLQYMQCGPDSSLNCYGDSTGTVEGHGWFALDMSNNPVGYTAVFAFPRTLATAGNAYPYIHEMNGAGLSPIDSYVYALVKVQVDSSTQKYRLIRFGSVHADRTNPAFEYVANTAFSVSAGESRSDSISPRVACLWQAAHCRRRP